VSPQERSMRARVAAYTLHSKVDGRQITSQARQAFMDRFERAVDPKSLLPVAERCRRASAARKAYFTALALKSSKSRKRNRKLSR
jgi:hypothetical protein